MEWTAKPDGCQICLAGGSRPVDFRTPSSQRPMASGAQDRGLRNCCISSFTGGFVMMRREIPAFAALIALSQTATAGVPLFGQVSCAVVRCYVAKYSEAAAEKWARGRGANDAEIETARRCLHGANVQTAARRPDDRASPVLAPVTEQQPTQREPADRDPDQDAGLHVVSVQGQRADPGQNSHDDEPGVHGLIGPT